MNSFRGFLTVVRVLQIGFVFALVAPTFVHAAAAQGGCEAHDYGLDAAASDNTAAFKKALASCAGKTIHIPQGTYTFSPHGYDNGMYMQEGTSLLGDGADGQSQTVLRMADTGSFASFLWVRDASHVSIRGIRFEGTSYDSGCSRRLNYGNAISVYSSKGSHAGSEDIRITENAFYNFNGHSWITVNAEDGSPGIGIHSEIAISKNTFHSDNRLSGSCAGTGGISHSVYMIWLHGSDASAQGMVENVSVSSNTLHADYVTGGVVVWSDTARITIQNNSIFDAGLKLPPNAGTELGRYAIAVYNSAHEKPGMWPDTVTIVGNTIVNAVSCGVYVASAKNLEISRNRISGQSDRNDVTLPKGGIAINHAHVRSIDGNELANNYIGITVVSGDVTVRENQITAAPGGIRIKRFRDDHSPAEIQK